MWNDDNDKIMELLKKYIAKDAAIFPMMCPVCEEKHGHIYMHRWKEGVDRGASWAWCSSCRVCSHCTISIPKWWENNEKIKVEYLAAHPDYLEKMKEMIDKHVEMKLDNTQ